MVKRHKVLAEYTLHMYCSKCGKRISDNRDFQHEGRLTENGKYIYDWYKYVYTCSCGNVEESRTQYPCTQLMFDEEGEIIDDTN